MVIEFVNRSFSVVILRHANENGNSRRSDNFSMRKATPKYWQIKAKKKRNQNKLNLKRTFLQLAKINTLEMAQSKCLSEMP